jgi:hypothetical protein
MCALLLPCRLTPVPQCSLTERTVPIDWPGFAGFSSQSQRVESAQVGHASTKNAVMLCSR